MNRARSATAAPTRTVLLIALGLLFGCGAEDTLCPEGFHSDSEGRCLELPGEPQPELRVLVGSLELTNVEAIEAFCDEYDAITGDLTVDAPELAAIDALACLQRVGGTLRIDDQPALTSVELPLLRRVGGDLYVQGNPQQRTLLLPALEQVEGGLIVQYLPRLEELVLPSLHSVKRFLSFYRTGGQRLILPELLTVGEHFVDEGTKPIEFGAPSTEALNPHHVLYIRVNLSLQEVSAPRLSSVAGVLKISSNEVLASVDMPALEELGAGLYLSFGEVLQVFELPALERIGGFLYVQRSPVREFSLPALGEVKSDVFVQHNPFMTILELPELADVGGSFFVTDNPSLAGSAVEELVDDIGEENISGPINTSGNGPG
ncbi:MAG: hypothetical protein VX498_11175 [Myxococcota bacterium]|nr:hypothetical protein [Myxococcota bacterium]